jgi:integrase
MPLTLYLRGKTWWLKGQIDELPKSEYYRRSTGKTSKQNAEIYSAHFRTDEIKRHYVGEPTKEMIFAEAVLLYEATEVDKGHLAKVMPYLEHLEISRISPQLIKSLGPKISPNNSCDTWHRQFVVPVRAVINNAHQEGLCSQITVRDHTALERARQDARRGKKSRQEKKPGNWIWILTFRKHAGPHLGAMCQFMYESAARIGQSVMIPPSDLDDENESVLVPAAKGVEARWVRVSSELFAELKNLPLKRPRRKNKSDPQHSYRLFGFADRGSVYKQWKAVCKAAGIELKMPHAAGRHGFATEMLNRQKVDLHAVAEAGGWADPSMVAKVYGHAENSTNKIMVASRTGRVQAEKQLATKALIKKDS